MTCHIDGGLLFFGKAQLNGDRYSLDIDIASFPGSWQVNERCFGIGKSSMKTLALATEF
jgi:hypothetical protein